MGVAVPASPPLHSTLLLFTPSFGSSDCSGDTVNLLEDTSLLFVSVLDYRTLHSEKPERCSLQPISIRGTLRLSLGGILVVFKEAVSQL
ncbi:unnamed protein product [Pleuronectes platessa]|uniref:Uncharacterized protein n=1 Tax=Pleuronectes platessa TaxID=8262 RepID=A0A9N7U1D3_PLEPL|nr:unnamed protein product [Pleuronectes platessa]